MTQALPRPFIEIRDFRPRLAPILIGVVATPVLMQVLLIAGREPARWLWQHGPQDWQDRPWIFVALAIAFQAVTGLIGVLGVKLVLPKLDAHLRWPKGKSLAGLAVLIGIAMGIIMLVADYWPQLLSHTAIKDYPVNPIDSSGWLFAMGITGLAEETIFRGLIVGMLVVLVPGRIRIGGLDLPVAAYLASLLFGLAHYDSFLVNPLHLAIAQQIYAFAWGLAYVWLMEKSDSLVAPMIAHGVGDAVEVGAVMMIAAAWS
ncbi:MAG TPA: CPBP family intramembrane glutamic endopeptidase [Hyphomonadaceae bacterium]|nr:CPBP family intramembrane glutamic endopeptidase [Hyphomonadaceae bacterium]